MPINYNNLNNSNLHLFVQNRYAYVPKTHGPFQGNMGQHPNSSNGTNTSRTQITCQICGLHGHSADRCRYRWDYAYQAHDNIPQALVTKDIDPTPYVDTGASAHITNDPGTITNAVP